MKRAIPIVILAVFLAGCSLPASLSSSPTPPESQIQTQVSDLLTMMPPTSTIPGVSAPTSPAPVFITATPQGAGPTATSAVITEIPSTPPAPEATQAPTAEPTLEPTHESPTATPTAPPSPTVIPPAGDPRSKLGQPDWEDTFANDQNWSTGGDQFTSATISNNQMVLTGVTTLDGWRITWPTLKNFYLEATIKVGTCSGTDRYGLIVRIPDKATADKGYLVGFNCQGQYSLRRWDGTKMIELIPWTTDKAILAGSNQTNRMGILAIDNQFTMYANGVLLKSAQDGTYSEGNFGVFVGANTTKDLAVTYTDIAFWENPTP